jgi:hypothetical protein
MITHPFSAAMFGDVIHVVRDRLVESETREQLMEAGGRYALGWVAL